VLRQNLFASRKDFGRVQNDPAILIDLVTGTAYSPQHGIGTRDGTDPRDKDFRLLKRPLPVGEGKRHGPKPLADRHAFPVWDCDVERPALRRNDSKPVKWSMRPGLNEQNRTRP
jgi:hypothetical protein